MAKRPVFVPEEKGTCLVHKVDVEFPWHPGMAPTQKKKNIAALHANAARIGISPLLEISSKSEDEIGRKLSAFYLPVKLDNLTATLESVFQGSKVFEQGGPFTDLYNAESRAAKRDPRLRSSGKLIKFFFEGKDYPLSPPTAFYDWLYIRALFPHREWMRRLQSLAGFTDIEFNPDRSLNCQARSCATYVALDKRGLLDEAVQSFDRFRELMQAASV